MEWIIGIVSAIWTLLVEIGIINTLFVILFLSWLRVIIKYVPDLFKHYFEQIEKSNEALDKAHERFSANLDTVTTKFVWGLDRISEEHDKQYDKLIDIHRDIKDCKLTITRK